MQDYQDQQSKELIKWLCNTLQQDRFVKEQNNYPAFVKSEIFDRTLRTTLMGLQADSHLINDPEIDQLAVNMLKNLSKTELETKKSQLTDET